MPMGIVVVAASAANEVDLLGNAELVEQAGEIAARAAARRIDIGDRLGVEQRPFESLDRADVGLGRTSLHMTPTQTRAKFARVPATSFPLPVGVVLDDHRVSGLTAGAYKQVLVALVLDFEKPP